MPSKTESGHAVNVANFNDLISYVNGYGRTYNPSNESIFPEQLQNLAASATTQLDAVYAAQAPYNAAVAAREVAFVPLSKLVTRVMSFLKASGVTPEVYESVLTVARKIKGTRASAKPKTTTMVEGETPVVETKTVSSSQMSYDSREENFAHFIQLLVAIPQYAPNEEELQVATLTALSADLKAKNTAVVEASVPLSNARIARDEVLYSPVTGLCDVAQTVKNYVKAVFGATSPQYKQISKLRFSKRKI